MAKTADAKEFVKTANYREQRWIYELSDDVTLDDVLRPDFWRTVHDRIKRLSVVTVIGGRDNLDIDLRCIGVGQGFCMMRVIRKAETVSSVAALANGERRVEYRPGYMWAIIGEDNSIIDSGFDSRDRAVSEMERLAA